MTRQHSFLHRFILLCAMVISTGCAAVDVRVESIIPATPTVAPTPQPLPMADVQAEFSAGLVAREAPDDDEVQVAYLAAPHLIYNSDGSVTVDMMPESAQDFYFVVNTGVGLRLRVDWRAIWVTGGAGGGKVGMDVYLRAPDAAEDDFRWVENASTAEFWEESATHHEELLDSTLYLPGTGDYGVRVEVKAEAWNEATGAYVEGLHTYQVKVMALNQPDDLLDTIEALSPAFGDLEEQGVFMDWRGWQFGPCFVRSEGNTAFTQLLDEGCSAFEDGDWDNAANALQDALSADDSPALQNRLRQQLGMLAGASGRWNVAVRHFTEGLSIAHSLHDSLEIAIALHNLGASLINAGFLDESEPYLWQAINLYDQMGDSRGAAVAWAELAAYWESLETLEWVIQTLYDHGLPQAAILQTFRDALQENQANEEQETSEE